MDSPATLRAASIDGDLPCVWCGYNLRTLPSDGRCPECDRPVVESVGGWGPVLTSRASVIRLRRWLGVLIVAICGYELIQLINRIGFLYGLQMGYWFRPFVNSWIYGSGLFQSLKLIAIAADAAYYTTTIITDLHPFRNDAAYGVGICAPAGRIAEVIMWVLLFLILPESRRSALGLLILAGLIFSIFLAAPEVMWFPANAWEPLTELVRGMAGILERSAFGGRGLRELISVFHLCCFWILYRRLGAALAMRPDRVAGNLSRSETAVYNQDKPIGHLKRQGEP